ncbi:hypothetical protein KDL01_09220 [Actinospica durhamensis]|uniref:Uncharacterized protein n=1 Tax=Actinospica durhamensis TaxID=1508375 RepID=A0A941ILV7_9ACTN|nr:hypothetical protein [Actinospica durhamensis]MBR7833445.1 hypothetical protein [Actinospica durhamensis]
MAIHPADAPFELLEPYRYHAVYDGREFRVTSGELAAVVQILPCGDERDPVPLTVQPEQLESWTRDWITFSWRGEPFVYRGHKDGLTVGDYLGNDPEFARRHCRFPDVANSPAYLPSAELTALEQHSTDVFETRAAEARAIEELGPLGRRTVDGHTVTRIYLYKGEEFEPFERDGLLLKCRYLGRNYFVWMHWILEVEDGPSGRIGYIRRRPSTLEPLIDKTLD